MDARFPTQYLNDRRILRMTPEQFRFYMMATAWSVSNMTDGRIEQDDLYLIPYAQEDLPPAMVKLGVWTVTDEGWLIADFTKTQTSAAQLEAALLNRRKADAERQRKKYEKDKTSHTADQGSREAHVRFEGKERQGKERQGKASLDEEVLTEQQKQTVWDETPSRDPRACTTCSQGRLTDYLVNQGSTSCNDCIRNHRAAA